MSHTVAEYLAKVNGKDLVISRGFHYCNDEGKLVLDRGDWRLEARLRSWTRVLSRSTAHFFIVRSIMLEKSYLRWLRQNQKRRYGMRFRKSMFLMAVFLAARGEIEDKARDGKVIEAITDRGW
jgi:hypothetical protein